MSPLSFLRPRFRACLAACLFGGALAPASAFAQDTITTDTRAAIIEPLTLTKISDLDFGDLVGATAGTIVLTPTATATCVATGGLIRSAECQPATFVGSGNNNQRVRVRRPVGNTITLTGPGANMTVTDITINGDEDLTPVRSNRNWERFRIASANGSFVFRVGGTLNVKAGQAPGLYTGTFDIRIDYQ
ncbi:MAG: DUF4402 domain-containing protein [Erythrobacter sp.]